MTCLGGYEEGYERCECFWGTGPGSLIKKLAVSGTPLRGLKVLDAGCGEGKNAAFLADKGASVIAVDLSARAVTNGRAIWGGLPVTWLVADIRSLRLPENEFDVVVAYGLLHCLATADEVNQTIKKLQHATTEGGFHVVCTFNSRSQDLRAHPGFQPTLVPHSFYETRYGEWELIENSDSDLEEIHPHNGIQHHHSMTRILARKGNN